MAGKNLLSLLIASATFLSATAQTATDLPKSSTTITGNADVYYKYDFAKKKANGLTSFTQSQNSFELGMASVKIEHKISKVTMVADLGFGKRAQDFSYNDAGIMASIKQLYVSYAPADWVKFTAGSWSTHIGYEVLDPIGNRNYSMSYMFTNGPFFHTGVKAEFTAGKNGFMVGIANPTDYKTVPQTGANKKFLLAQYSLAASDNVKGYLNFVAGQFPNYTKNNQIDLVLTAKLASKFSVAYNGTVSNSKFRAPNGSYGANLSWWGSALYLNLDPKPWFGLTLRGELFSDKHQVKVFSSAAEGGQIFATTLSGNFKIDNLVIIPEIRLDNASNKGVFIDKNGVAKSGAANFLVAAVYQF
ncbi:MAG: outer membrane beta-barrel protein [Chitinophagaceae bacterium]